ncbi:MAG: hypothetical protein D3917_08360 [Candidatus Electrothrix sp. AX5]|nr:hypothetical protein [Candidatus Electrothrix sp. AX5]
MPSCRLLQLYQQTYFRQPLISVCRTADFLFFPNYSNDNVKIGLVGQMTCLPPAETKIFLSGNVRRNMDEPPVYTCINATLTAEAITEEAEGDSFFQHIKTERSGSAYII